MTEELAPSLGRCASRLVVLASGRKDYEVQVKETVC